MDVLVRIKRLAVARRRSRSSARLRRSERLYVIESPTFLGTWVYTKGTIRRKGREEVFYVFVSAKLAVQGAPPGGSLPYMRLEACRGRCSGRRPTRRPAAACCGACAA